MKTIFYLALCVSLALAATRAPAEEPGMRDKARAAMKAGNRKDAFEIFQKLINDPKTDPALVGQDLEMALQCLRQLGREEEVDDVREKAIAVHPGNWRLLSSAAQTMDDGQQYGFIIAGKFSRGHHRGGGRYVYTMERDRIRALQLFQQALPLAQKDAPKPELSRFYTEFAAHLSGGRRQQVQAWRLQDLSDWKTLPDYDEGYNYYGYQPRPAPVDADGKPVYFNVAETFETAKSDGERWRWLLEQAIAADPNRTSEIRFQFASFQHQQFGVQTMAGVGRFGADDGDDVDESGPFAVNSLGEDETIARLATGIKRFKMPDEFNPVVLFQKIADGKGSHADNALNSLAQIFEDRQQYPKAAATWKRNIAEHGDPKGNKQQRLNQIIGNWGAIEPLGTQAAVRGEDGGAAVDFRFRNGKKVTFTAHELDVPRLLADVKKHITAEPAVFDWQQIDLNNIGFRIVDKDQTQYLLKEAAKWDLELKPREAHFDRRINVVTPLKKAGAYLLSATMENGNTSRMVVWVADTVILKKPVDNQIFCYVADAITGAPVPNAKVDIFGFRHTWDGRTRGVVTSEFAAATNNDGQVLFNEQAASNDSWLITATTGDGRLAYLGFTHFWFSKHYDGQPSELKIFGITDRPVYRPNNPVKFKVWAATAQYDREGRSDFAGRPADVEIYNPKGEKIFTKNYTLDEYGGLAGEFTLDKEATLGQYRISCQVNPQYGYMPVIAFRLEEYKKPEFEVKVDAPTEPVMLGEKIAAKITAKYFFGAPVVEAKVKYKVLRHRHTGTWYPSGTWDWFYGSGYWWYAADYPWYPGWREWGCCRPIQPWWGWRQPEQPEVVLENEVPVGKDGTVSVEIDTALAKAMMGDSDHRYELTAEVTDNSRRTIVGTGSVTVARKPFKVYAWLDRGHYKAGDTVKASFAAQTLDNKPVKGDGLLKLLKITYDKDQKPVETPVQEWPLASGETGRADQQIKASEPGQFRLSYTVTDEKKHVVEGGYVFTISGEGFEKDSSKFRFNAIELVTDKREYAPGEKIQLQINTDRAGGTVLLFPRASDGAYVQPKILRLDGKSTVESLDVTKGDMPNVFIEAVTIHGGKVHSEVRQVAVPPEKRVVNVEVLPNETRYKPGEKARLRVKLSGLDGKPVAGSAVVSVYDKSVEYISGGSNVSPIRNTFWGWRRHHNARNESSLDRFSQQLLKKGERALANLGVFGALAADMIGGEGGGFGGGKGEGRRRGLDEAKAEKASAPGAPKALAAAAPSNMAAERKQGADAQQDTGGPGDNAEPSMPMVEPSVRKNFADTAYWNGTLSISNEGIMEVEVPMPESLTTWKMKVWVMGEGTRVGQGEMEVITSKDVIVRLQAPRFFTQKDEVVISANVHNYLKEKKWINVGLDVKGGVEPFELVPGDRRGLAHAALPFYRKLELEPGGEGRVDWRLKVNEPGEVTLRVSAETNADSDAMEMTFPAYVHGMLKTDSFSGAIRPDKVGATLAFAVPEERLPEQSRLEIRYSPTLAGAMVDALPYLVEYPYGCTEQTLNRFLPTVITQNVLMRMNLDLKDIKAKITNLNAQEIGDDKARAGGWQRYPRNPVWDVDEVRSMAIAGVERLINMQCSDGGWGWFSGNGERSYPHTTAVVVHGLQLAKANSIKVDDHVIAAGVEWLKNHQAEELRRMKLPADDRWFKKNADNLDALVYMVLVDSNADQKEMRELLYRDRNELAVYSKAMFGLALHRVKDKEKLAMIIQNVDQFLVQDDENQTAYLKLPEGNHWWYWYGSEYEAQAYYLKLLAATDPKSEKASRLVKYLINNRKHASYWNSTRDTAICVEAIAEYLTASGEDAPDMTLEIHVDGKKAKEVVINASNLFTFDNKLIVTGKDVTAGKHTVEFKKKGVGPVYFNAYVTNFTLEDHITKAGLEIKVERKYYKLKAVDKQVKVEGNRGQSVATKVEKYEREPLANLATLKSGELVEIELEIESKNDYEYILFEDMKAAGFEPMEVRSGYNANMGAYMELRDERVCFFVRSLARGKHSVSYRMRAEIPGTFSALPTKASAMYAPELKANSDEIKMKITD